MLKVVKVHKIDCNSRFCQENIEGLLVDTKCKSTEYKDKHAVKLFKEFLQSEQCKNVYPSVENMNNIELDDCLSKFYAYFRKNDGNYLKRNLIQTFIRYLSQLNPANEFLWQIPRVTYLEKETFGTKTKLMVTTHYQTIH